MSLFYNLDFGIGDWPDVKMLVIGMMINQIMFHQESDRRLSWNRTFNRKNGVLTQIHVRHAKQAKEIKPIT